MQHPDRIAWPTTLALAVVLAPLLGVMGFALISWVGTVFTPLTMALGGVR